ncbi:MAG: response regulator [Actinobacteria bacterium]|nr:response regulator [Actinomycetota bacterium]
MIRVLLVDDATDIRMLVRMGLRRDGRFDVVGEASNGVEAIEQAAQHQPDVVLLDVAMPLMDGLEALPRIRDVAPDARVVILSGFTSESMQEGATTQGADAYLEKGTPLPRIAELLAEVVGRPAER